MKVFTKNVLKKSSVFFVFLFNTYPKPLVFAVAYTISLAVKTLNYISLPRYIVDNLCSWSRLLLHAHIAVLHQFSLLGSYLVTYPSFHLFYLIYRDLCHRGLGRQPGYTLKRSLAYYRAKYCFCFVFNITYYFSVVFRWME